MRRFAMNKRGPRTSVREAVNERVEWLLSLCGAQAREGTVLLAREGEEVRGAAVLRLASPDAEILALVTDPNCRHRGVGRELVLEMARRARRSGCTRLRVRVARSDDAALGFFSALGFDDTHVALDLAL